MHGAGANRRIRRSYCPVQERFKSGPLTVAGRALANNPVSRPGSAFPVPTGNPAAINGLAHEVVGEILSDPGTVKILRGNVHDIIAPDGRGLRFNADGTLKDLLEP